MLIGTYSTEDSLQKWFITKLPDARKRLSQFIVLNELLDGFRDYDKKLYKNIRNSVMCLCLPHGYDQIQLAKLAELEEALETFNVKQLTQRKYNHLKSRLASGNFTASFSAQTELEIALRIAKRVGSTNVTLFPKLDSGKYSDIQCYI